MMTTKLNYKMLPILWTGRAFSRLQDRTRVGYFTFKPKSREIHPDIDIYI